MSQNKGLKGPRSLNELMQSGEIARLQAEAAERRNAAHRVRALLPAAEAEHVVNAHIDAEGRLVVGMDSGAWAARLRYLASELGGRPLVVRVAPPDDPGSG
jgi:hypothetical protein